jgi:hypothetical protein
MKLKEEIKPDFVVSLLEPANLFDVLTKKAIKRLYFSFIPIKGVLKDEKNSYC